MGFGVLNYLFLKVRAFLYMCIFWRNIFEALNLSLPASKLDTVYILNTLCLFLYCTDYFWVKPSFGICLHSCFLDHCDRINCTCEFIYKVWICSIYKGISNSLEKGFFNASLKFSILWWKATNLYIYILYIFLLAMLIHHIYWKNPAF